MNFLFVFPLIALLLVFGGCLNLYFELKYSRGLM